MLKGLKGKGIIVLFFAASFIFLATLGESLGQIQIKVSPGEPASPVGASDAEKDEALDAQKNKDLAFEEMQRLELVLSEPLIFFVQPTLKEEGYLFDKNK